MDIAEPATRLRGDPPSASTPQGTIDRKELAFVAMERTRMPMVITDPRQADNPIVLANKAFLNETGYNAEEVIGRNCRFLQGPDSDPNVISQVRDAMRQERDVTVELINYRKDGSSFWNQLYVSPVHDEGNRLLYFFASQMDTTKRHEARQLEAAEHKLLLEVDHRAKNALALVQGIVRLTKREEAGAFAEAVQGRVDALARAHAILAEGRWRDVPLDRVVRAEIEPLGSRRVRISGDDARLTAAQVQPVALLLHELAANARRHGAFSVVEGVLSIDWKEEACSRELCIRWTETGGPAPASLREPGYGQAMIEAIASRQLRGRIGYEWSDAGLVAHVIIPRMPCG